MEEKKVKYVGKEPGGACQHLLNNNKSLLLVSVDNVPVCGWFVHMGDNTVCYLFSPSLRAVNSGKTVPKTITRVTMRCPECERFAEYPHPYKTAKQPFLVNYYRT
jgi:hypothetical protein